MSHGRLLWRRRIPRGAGFWSRSGGKRVSTVGQVSSAEDQVEVEVEIRLVELRFISGKKTKREIRLNPNMK